MTRPDPFTTARAVLREKFPTARLAFVAGSFNRGEATDSSDIDLVVVFDRLEHAWRESFTFGGWPVEAFVHDPETLAAFLRGDAGRGQAILMTMILEGPAIPQDCALAGELKTLAAAMLTQGPPPWDTETLEQKRYAVTDIVDDLRDPRTPLEAAALLGALHEELGEFYFRSRRLWSSSRKHIPRRLDKADPDLARRWSKAFLAAWAGERGDVIQLAAEILQPFGGCCSMDTAATHRRTRGS